MHCFPPRLSFSNVGLRWLAFLAVAASGYGQVVFYSGGSAKTNWLAAAGSPVVTLDFESISAGTQANNAGFATYAATAGIVFRAFSNSTYPEVNNGSGGIGQSGPNWLGNFPSQGFAVGNAISWTFNKSIRSFGFYDVGSDDGFTVSIYSTSSVLLNSFDTTEQSGTPLFWGFVANQDIGRVDIQPRIGNGYIGIDALSTVAVPEPTVTAAAMGGAVLAFVRVIRRRRTARVLSEV